MMSANRRLGGFGAVVLTIAAAAAAAAQTPSPVPTATHGAVGSWFGKAIELCPQGVSPASCSFAGPALALFMTPTITPDGRFIGDDSFTLGTAPLGPHTNAFGQWIATSATEFTADYVFMLNTFPPNSAAPISAVRFRWAGHVADANTLDGYVNMYFSPALATTWVALGVNDFPIIPSEANILITPPAGVVKDPTLCMTPGCPLVFKFTIKRVAP